MLWIAGAFVLGCWCGATAMAIARISSRPLGQLSDEWTPPTENPWPPHPSTMPSFTPLHGPLAHCNLANCPACYPYRQSIGSDSSRDIPIGIRRSWPE